MRTSATPARIDAHVEPPPPDMVPPPPPPEMPAQPGDLPMEVPQPEPAPPAGRESLGANGWGEQLMLALD